MSSTGAGNAIIKKEVTEFGDPAADWDGGLLANSAGYFDAIAEHLYSKAMQAFDSQRQAFVNINDSVTDQARRLSNRVRCVVEAWEEYQKRFPNLNMSKIPVAVDEWSTGVRGGEILSAISAAEALQEMFRHSDLFVVSGYTAMTSLLASAAEAPAIQHTSSAIIALPMTNLDLYKFRPPLIGNSLGLLKCSPCIICA
jgi:hypothetical protein